ncbi:MAG: sugar kinase [Rhodomicrobiaceae bacterium]
MSGGLDILALGEPLIEFNRQSDGRWLQGFGGDVSNCAIAAARQGARSGMLAHQGKDRFGDRLMALWESEGVDTSRVTRTDAPSGIYFVDHDENGHHFTYYRKGSAASCMTPADIRPELFEGVKILHVSGISQAISETARAAVDAAIRQAKQTGARISYDTNLRLSLWPLDEAKAVINPTVPKADILLPGYDDARQLIGLEDPDAIMRHYLDQGIGIVGLTLGSDGALIGTQDEVRRLEPHKVESVDATGAGDTFDGAMLARLIAGDDPFTAAIYANAAAALSTTGYSAVAPIPRTDEVRAFLAKH